MKVSWTKNQSKDKAKGITQNFKEASLMRGRLKELLLEKIDLSNKESRAKGSYANTSWPFIQADARGYERALQEIIELIGN